MGTAWDLVHGTSCNATAMGRDIAGFLFSSHLGFLSLTWSFKLLSLKDFHFLMVLPLSSVS